MSKKLGIAWTIPFLGFAIGYLGTYFFVQQNSIITPNVIGKGLQDCAEILSQNRLGIRILKELEDSSLPQGVVMDQFPRGGQKVRPNQDIFITVSRRPKIFLTPDFTNLKQKDVLTISAKHGIDLNSVFLFSYHPVNSCIAQNPRSGDELGRRRVTAFFSKGQFPLFVVPNFKNCLVQDVKNLLNQYDAQLDIINTSTVSELESRVVEQSPAAGSIVSVDRPIQVQLQVG